MPPTPLHDAIVVGGSYAGLSAALQLGRARRRVLVIDAGQPRNRFASHAHGVFAQDGRPGREMLDEARAQLARYATVTLLQATATDAQPLDDDAADGFVVQTDDGGRPAGRRLLLATGYRDQPPALPGVAERWGRSVLHCPYCHGYEIGGGPIGVLAAMGPMAAQYAMLVADWGPVTLFTHGQFVPDAETHALLAARGVAVEPVPVAAVEGPGDTLRHVLLQDGRRVAVDALFVGQQPVFASPLAARLGCAIDDTPGGPLVRTDPQRMTTVPGVYAAGDIAQAPSNISMSVASGVLAGAMLHHSLVAEDAARGAAARAP
ncbi:NAD(P)/FAD-dependent oxidoreductase [uncultured Xylophilus sp.]|uniref:NAD(P)/FAD-dependent oxidoreductase n=1 Tax=uncultured Xylophilus sp. TaxID=296832 RepID=UPI0025EF4EDC|nr:NAD(P)/FAD-dependent oxidoreductase [uncultured Xylophilus sp.]